MFKMHLTFVIIFALSFTSNAETLIGRPDFEVNKFFQRTDGITSGDGGYSVVLKDKRTIWLFADSHYNDMSKGSTTQPCLFNARNSIMVQPLNDWSHEHTKAFVGAPTPFKSLFKADNDKAQFYWTGHGVELGDTAYIYCAELENTGTGGNFGFRSTGNDHWCKLSTKHLNVSGYAKLPNFNGINFGAGFVDNNDNFIYTYGQKGQGFHNDMYVARFSKLKPEKHDSWQYWNGTHWTDKISQIKSVFYNNVNSMSVSKVKNKYVAFSTEFSVACDQGHYIYAHVSDSITGPFREKKAIHSIDEAKERGHYPFFYMAIGHPELINNSNELLITYSINGYGPCIESCPNGKLDPNYYRLRGVRVNIDKLFSLFK